MQIQDDLQAIKTQGDIAFDAPSAHAAMDLYASLGSLGTYLQSTGQEALAGQVLKSVGPALTTADNTAAGTMQDAQPPLPFEVPLFDFFAYSYAPASSAPPPGGPASTGGLFPHHRAVINYPITIKSGGADFVNTSINSTANKVPVSMPLDLYNDALGDITSRTNPLNMSTWNIDGEAASNWAAFRDFQGNWTNYVAHHPQPAPPSELQNSSGMVPVGPGTI